VYILGRYHQMIQVHGEMTLWASQEV